MYINWQQYQAPNKEAIKEIPSQLDYLFSANDSPENIEYFGLMVKCTPERGQKCSLFHLMVKCTPIIVELPSVYRGCKSLICFQ